jgi:DNA polymerase-4
MGDYVASCQIFDESWKKIPIRHLGIHTSHVTYDSYRQLNIFDTMDHTIFYIGTSSRW